MKKPGNMHRPSSLIAAVLLTLSQVLNIAAARSASSVYYTPIFLLELFGNALIAVALSVILLRGRKDTTAAVVFLIAIIAPALSVTYDLLVARLVYELIYYKLVCIFGSLLLAAFWVLSAWECWTGGKVSADGRRVLLWLLPILCFGFELWAQMLLCRYNGIKTEKMITSSLIYTIPQWLGPALMGISLSIPDKRNDG